MTTTSLGVALIVRFTLFGGVSPGDNLNWGRPHVVKACVRLIGEIERPDVQRTLTPYRCCCVLRRIKEGVELMDKCALGQAGQG